MVCLQKQQDNGSERRDFLTLSELPKRRRKAVSAAVKLRRRVEVVMFAAATLGLCWLAGSSAVQDVRAAFSHPPHLATTTITVVPGDSIWSISKAIASHGELQSNVADEIRQLNPSLRSGSTLTAGETIKIPRVST
jgi:LysM repeat protein